MRTLAPPKEHQRPRRHPSQEVWTLRKRRGVVANICNSSTQDDGRGFQEFMISLGSIRSCHKKGKKEKTKTNVTASVEGMMLRWEGPGEEGKGKAPVKGSMSGGQ